MTAKEIYERIDLSQLPEEKADKLRQLEVKTKGFTISNDKVDESMRNLYAQLKEKKPSALKDLKVEIKKEEIKKGDEVIIKETEEVVGKKEVTKKTPTPSSGKKETITEVAKKIRKADEPWRTALKRAGEQMRNREDEANKQVKTELQKLIEFVKNDPNFKDFPRTYGKGRKDIDLLKDASEKALAPGRRVSKKGHMNQYGASKGGRKYTENRDNRSDREASKFNKNIFLAKGGRVHRAEQMENGGEIFVPVQILANNPDALVNTTTMNELFAKGGITTPSLFKLQDEVWDKFKFESGQEIKSTQQNRMKFSKAMDEALKSRGVAKESLSLTIFEKLEDENAHTLNEFLILNDYYKPSVWPEGKEFYLDRAKKNPRSGLGKDGIVTATTKASKSTSKGYKAHDTIKLIIIKNPNANSKKNFLQIDGSDVLNGVYDSTAFANGGTLPRGYKYIRRGDISQVVTKKNEIIFNPKNGFWVDKEAISAAENKFEAGGEVYVPVQIDANNPDVLVQTTSMSELFAKGGYVDVQANLMKELQKLQRDLNSQRLSTYMEGDNSEEEIARQRERAAKLARFNEILELLRELESKKMAEGGKIYASDDAYRVNVMVDGEVKETLIIRGRHKAEVRMIIEDMYEDKMEDKYGEDIMFEIIEAKGDGGKIGFEALSKKVAARYVGEKVKPQYQDEYGKTYSAEEAKEVGDKVAAKVYRQKQGKMAKGGNVFYEGQSVMFPLTKSTRLDRGVKNLFNQYANKELVIGKIDSNNPYDNAEAFLKSTGEKVPFTLTLNPKYLFPYEERGVMAEGGFVAIFNGKKINIEADSLYAAKLKAIEELKVPKSKQGLLSVVSNKSMANQDFKFMADGGRLEAQSLEMAKNISVQIAHHAEELKDALNGKTYVEPWVTSMLQRAADNLSDATHYLEGNEQSMADGGAINVDTKKRFDVDFYKSIGDRQTSHEEIIRGDKFSDVVSQATEVAKSKGLNYVEFYYKNLFIGSIDKRNGYEFKKGRDSQKSPLSVNEEQVKTEGFAEGGMMAKGGKIREWDDVYIISKNKLGMVELIFNDVYYVTTPFGETFEATIDDLKKIVTFDKGGEVMVGEIASIAKENKATGDEVVKKISTGADVEMEHTEDRKVAMRIAVDHLKEDFNYYEKLRKAGL